MYNVPDGPSRERPRNRSTLRLRAANEPRVLTLYCKEMEPSNENEEGPRLASVADHQVDSRQIRLTGGDRVASREATLFTRRMELDKVRAWYACRYRYPANVWC